MDILISIDSESSRQIYIEGFEFDEGIYGFVCSLIADFTIEALNFMAYPCSSTFF